MFGVSAGELTLIIFIALLVLDPKKIPDYGNKIGKVMREWRNIKNGIDDKIKTALDEPTPKEKPEKQSTEHEPQ